jgi:hypothetical protein
MVVSAALAYCKNSDASEKCYVSYEHLTGLALRMWTVVVSSTLVCHRYTSAGKMLLDQGQSLVGVSHPLWCYHRLSNIVFNISPVRERLFDGSLSSARAILCGNIINFGVLSLGCYH